MMTDAHLPYARAAADITAHAARVQAGAALGWPADYLRACQGLPPLHPPAPLVVSTYPSWVPGDPYTKQRCVRCGEMAYESYVGRHADHWVPDRDLDWRRVPLCTPCSRNTPNLAQWCHEYAYGVRDTYGELRCRNK